MALTNATVDSRSKYSEGHLYVEEINVSGLTSGLLTNIPHSGPSGLAPKMVEAIVTTEPTDGSLVGIAWENSDTTNDEVDIRFRASPSGSLSGAVIKLRLKFLEVASQDGSSITVPG